MSKMLSGLSLEDFFFIGITERFNDDLLELAEELKWSKHSACVLNATDYPTVAQDIRNEICKANELDEELYNKVLEQRKLC